MMLLLAVGCARVAWTDVEIVDEREVPGEDDLAEFVQSWLDEFAALSAIDRAPLKRVRLVDFIEYPNDFEGELPEWVDPTAGAGGAYDPGSWEIELAEPGALKHELCHALDHGAGISKNNRHLFRMKNWPESLPTPAFDGRKEEEEVFAGLCDQPSLGPIAAAVDDTCPYALQEEMVTTAHALAFPSLAATRLPPVRIDADWVDLPLSRIGQVALAGDALVVLGASGEHDALLRVGPDGEVAPVPAPPDLSSWWPLPSDGAVVLLDRRGRVFSEGVEWPLSPDSYTFGAVEGSRVLALSFGRKRVVALDLDSGAETAIEPPGGDVGVELLFHEGHVAAVAADGSAWWLDGTTWVPMAVGRPTVPDRDASVLGWLDDGQMIVSFHVETLDPLLPEDQFHAGNAFWREGEVALATDVCTDRLWRLRTDGRRVWAVDDGNLRAGKVTLGG